MPPKATAKQFLTALWGDQEGVAELTVIGPKGLQSFGFTYPASLDAILTASKNHAPKVNVYMGVCLRKPGTKIGNGVRGKATDALSANAVWMEGDFKTTPEVELRKRLAEFPLKPSIVVRSGGGIHVYWLLKEPTTEFEKVYGIHESLIIALGGGRESKDMARILRVPETLNHKYTPAPTVEVTYFTDNRYSLSDFDFLPAFDSGSPSLNAPQSETTEPHDVPSLDLPDEVREKIEELLTEIWIDGYRHRLALYVAGIFAHAGINIESCKAVVAKVSTGVGGTTVERVKDVENTYKAFAAQKKVGGAGLLEKMIRDEFPPIINRNAVKVFEEIRRTVRKATPKKGLINFKIERLIKFDSRPAQYRAILRTHEGQLLNVDVSRDDLMRWGNFQQEAFEQTDTMLHCKPSTWTRVVGSTPIDVQPAPQEASVMGALETRFDTFLGAREEIGDISDLKGTCGYDESETFFRLEALAAILQKEKIDVDRSKLCQFLRSQGYDTSSKRFGDTVTTLWLKKHTEFAPKNGNGHVTKGPEEQKTDADLKKAEKGGEYAF